MYANQIKNLFQRNWAGFVCCVLALAGVLLVSCNATVSPSSFPKINGESIVNPGDIAFTAVVYNGDSEFSFVPTTNISAGVSIFFTNYSYDPTNNTSSIAPLVDESTNIYPTSNYPGIGSVNWQAVTVGGNGVTITEGTVAYVVGSSGLAAYSQVIIGNTSNTTDQLQGGSVYGVTASTAAPVTYLTLNHNGAGHKILAYFSNGGTNTYVAAVMFGPDSWTTSGSIAAGAFWDSYLPAGLSTTNSTDLSALWNGTQSNSQDGNLGQFNVNGNNDQNQNAVLNSCQNTLAGIVNPANWQADGNESKTKVILAGTGLVPCANAGYTGLIP